MRASLAQRLGFLLLSAALHALVLGLLWGVSLTPPVPLRVVLVAPRQAPGETPLPRGRRAGPPATPPRSAATPAAAPPAAAVAFAPRPRRRLTPRLHLEVAGLELTAPASAPASRPASPEARDASAYAPGDARLALLLRADRIRATPYLDATRRVLAAFPDHRTLLERTGLDPLTSFDSILIATANPFDLTATFLAARYTFPEARLRQSCDRRAAAAGRPLAWRHVAGRPVADLLGGPAGDAADPRVLLLARPGLAVLTRPAQVAAIAAAAPAATAAAPPGGPQSAPASAPGDGWGARLSLLEAERGGDPTGPALLLTLHEVRGYVRAAPGESLPIPTTVRLAVSDLARHPTATAELSFDTPTEASAFARGWPPRAQRLATSTVVYLLGLADLPGRIRVTAHGATVRATGTLRPDELLRLLHLLAEAGPVRPDPDGGVAAPPTSAPASAPGSAPPGIADQRPRD